MGVKGRTKGMTGLILHGSHLDSLRKDLLEVATRRDGRKTVGHPAHVGILRLTPWATACRP